MPHGKASIGPKFLDLKDVKLIPGIDVERVTFDMPERGSPKATGVYLADGQCIRAKKKIVVSAGTYNSPKLPMLSGIGDEKSLAQHGIDCVCDNPHAGKNLSSICRMLLCSS